MFSVSTAQCLNVPDVDDVTIVQSNSHVTTSFKHVPHKSSIFESKKGGSTQILPYPKILQ